MSLLRAILSYDPTGWRPVGALLRFLGVTLAVLIGGWAAGRGGAVLAGLGALYAGMASFGGVHQARLKRMIAATSFATVTTLLGCLVQPSDFWTITVVTLAAFGFSLLAAAGPDAAQAAVQAVAILAVLSGLQGSHDYPLGNAALVLGGGLGMAAVLMAFHPISPVAAERRAMEAVYLSLARFCRNRSEPLPAPGPHAKARDLLREGFSYNARPELLKLWRELELADALRGSLAGLARTGLTAEEWEKLAGWLASCADDIARGRPVETEAPQIRATGDAELWARRFQRAVEAERDEIIPVGIPAPRSWIAALKNVEALRALALGHAARYAVAVGISVAGYRLFKVDHGYWAAIAVAFSLRPDFVTTLTRGLGRIIGTALGVLLASLFVAVFHPSTAGLTLGMLAAVWFAFALQNASYVGFSAGLAFYVVCSVTLSGMSIAMAGQERIWATAAGSILALTIALVWPRWEADKTRTVLATAFAAQAQYADSVADFDPETAAAYRFQARAARLEAERIVQAAGFEPRWIRRKHLEGASAALGRLAENAARILTVHAAALDPHAGPQPPEDLKRLAAEDRGIAADLMG